MADKKRAAYIISEHAGEPGQYEWCFVGTLTAKQLNKLPANDRDRFKKLMSDGAAKIMSAGDILRKHEI